MEIKQVRFLIAAVLLVFGLAACTRPASKPPTEQVTPGATTAGNFPLPGTSDVMGQLEAFATQTAQAMQGGAAIPTTPQAPAPGTPSSSETPGAVVPGQETAQAPAVSSEVPASGATVETPAAALPTETAAPAKPTVIVPTATPGIPTSYRLKSGEFPYCIARRFNVNPSELLSINGLGTSSQVAPGTTLQIPQTGNPFPGSRSLREHPTTYTVKAGDSIGSIACLFGDVDPSSIAIANGISENQALNAGETLQIP